MMTFRAGCGPVVHINTMSQKQRMCVCVIKAWGRQFTTNCCTGIADLATVVSQALGIKFYGATAYHGQCFSCCLELHNPYHSNCIALMLSEYRMLGALGVLNSFSSWKRGAIEKEDLLDRLGSRLVISANNSDWLRLRLVERWESIQPLTEGKSRLTAREIPLDHSSLTNYV